MLHTLPDEVLAKCLAILPHVELLDVQRVCKSWVKLRRSKEFRVARAAVDEHALVVTNWTDAGDCTNLGTYALVGGSWRKMAPNDVTLMTGAATSFRGDFIIIGNGEPPRAYDDRTWPEAWHSGCAFNVETNSWRPLEWAPGVQDRIVIGVTSTDAMVVALCGENRPDDLSRYDFALKCYKPGADHTIDGWRLLPMPPVHAWGIGRIPLCLVGDVLYLVGGVNADEAPPPWSASTMLQALDMNTLEWTIGPPMPEPRVEGLAVAADGKLFVLGGFSEYGHDWPPIENLSSVYSFDPRTATWRSEPDVPRCATEPRLPSPPWPGAWGNGMNAVAHEGKVCVFGIENSPPLALADGVWTGLPSLPDEYCFGYGRKLHNPSANRDPMLGSVPLP